MQKQNQPTNHLLLLIWSYLNKYRRKDVDIVVDFLDYLYKINLFFFKIQSLLPVKDSLFMTVSVGEVI